VVTTQLPRPASLIDDGHGQCTDDSLREVADWVRSIGGHDELEARIRAGIGELHKTASTYAARHALDTLDTASAADDISPRCAWCGVLASLLDQPLGRTGCCSVACAAGLAGRLAADRAKESATLERLLRDVGAGRTGEPQWQEKTWARIREDERKAAEPPRSPWAWPIALILAALAMLAVYAIGGLNLALIVGGFGAVIAVVARLAWRWVLDRLWPLGRGGGNGGGL
jgi:hypothetical protein